MSGQQAQTFKARLPTWVKLIELLLISLFLTSIFLALVFGLSAAHAALNANAAKPDGADFGLIIFSSLFAALVPAMLLTNLISWSIPATRRANLAAFEGLQTASFSSANIGLMNLGAVLIPICTIAAAVGVYDPWVR